MAINTLTHTVNLDAGTNRIDRHLEFGRDFIDWMYDNWPGSEVLTKNSIGPGESNWGSGDIPKVINEWDPVVRTARTASPSDSSHIRFYSGASSIDGAYVGMEIRITAGPGINSVATITEYVGSTQTATVSPAFSATPTTSTKYNIRDTWVPDWFRGGWTDSSHYRYTTGCITFSHAPSQTDWCIVTCVYGSSTTGSTSTYTQIGIGLRSQNNGQVFFGELSRFSDDTFDINYLNTGESITFVIPYLANQYCLFSKQYNAVAQQVPNTGLYWFGIVYLDNPANELDTDAWVMLGQGLPIQTKFTKALDSESLGFICRLVTDTLLPEDTNFDKNVYTGKIPLARVWAGTAEVGMRGFTSNLVCVPQSYLTAAQLYTINEGTYYGLGTFDNHIQLPGTGNVPVGQRVLLKV